MAKKADGEKIEWLEALEERVREATGRLEELGAENERLVKRVKELEKEKGDGGGNEEWEKEREEIRGRVEKLTETLEGLLEE
jgi:seryl-tRNA synthetase